MALFEWNEGFCTGISSIDEQHKALVGYINKLHDSLLKGHTEKDLIPILEGLIDYTNGHFKHEEQLFEKYSYPHAKEHVDGHQELLDQVLEFRKRVDSEVGLLGSELLVFLKGWLLNHIMNEDMQYKNYLIEHGVQ